LGVLLLMDEGKIEEKTASSHQLTEPIHARERRFPYTETCAKKGPARGVTVVRAW